MTLAMKRVVVVVEVEVVMVGVGWKRLFCSGLQVDFAELKGSNHPPLNCHSYEKAATRAQYSEMSECKGYASLNSANNTQTLYFTIITALTIKRRDH